MRGLAERFEHRLFLSATPHNGHSNSFSSLLEILDPQRFTRGVPVRPRELDAVMVRRLKSDLRYFGEKFPERVVDPIRIDGLPSDTPELVLSRKLAEYGEVIRARTANLPPREAGYVRLTFVGLQQRLLSSIAAFAKTLEVHRKGVLRADVAASEAAAEEFVRGGAETEDEPVDELSGEKLIQDEEDQAAEAAGAIAASVSDLALVDEMLEIARKHGHRPDARIRRLEEWIRANMAPDGRWNERRLVLFTEYEDTRRWVEKRLAEALDDLQPDDRIASFTGATPLVRREELKRRFNDPQKIPLRILVCTDAAREGINLQMRCHDLIHIDLPWNPARLEQRNGRIDRKLQPSPKVWCRYFVYEQREEDVVLRGVGAENGAHPHPTRLCRPGDWISVVGSPRTGRHHASEVPRQGNRRGGRRGLAEDCYRRDGRRDRGEARERGPWQRRCAVRPGRRPPSRASALGSHGDRRFPWPDERERKTAEQAMSNQLGLCLRQPFLPATD